LHAVAERIGDPPLQRSRNQQQKKADDPTGLSHAAQGSYQAERDGGLNYTYTGAWTDRGHWCTWYAEVYRDSERKGRFSGSLLTLGTTPATVIRQLVEYSIEEMVQIVK